MKASLPKRKLTKRKLTKKKLTKKLYCNLFRICQHIFKGLIKSKKENAGLDVILIRIS